MAVAAAYGAANLAEHLNSLNGPNDYRPAREQYGGIAQNMRLVTPPGFVVAQDISTANIIATDSAHFSFLPVENTSEQVIGADGNFAAIRGIADWRGIEAFVNLSAIQLASLPMVADRFHIALLRGILLTKGLLWAYDADTLNWTIDTRRVYGDETITPGDMAGLTNARRNEMLNFMATDQGLAIMRNWHLFPVISAIVFMTRGHHFVGNDNVAGTSGTSGRYTYSALYRAILGSVVDINIFGFSDLSVIFREALHPFGVNSFYRFMVFLRDNNRLPPQLLLRSTPAPAGMAKITTAAAISRVLASSTYMNPVRENYNRAMESVHRAAEMILTRPELFHQVAILYTSDRITEQQQNLITRATEQSTGQAPILVAFAEVECAGASISYQKALLRSSDEQVGKKKRWRKIFKHANDDIEKRSITESMVAEFGVDEDL